MVVWCQQQHLQLHLMLCFDSCVSCQNNQPTWKYNAEPDNAQTLRHIVGVKGIWTLSSRVASDLYLSMLASSQCLEMSFVGVSHSYLGIWENRQFSQM